MSMYLEKKLITLNKAIKFYKIHRINLIPLDDIQIK